MSPALAVVGLISGWVGKVAIEAREQTAQNALINRRK
jgi:hypothetical protein